MHERQGPDETTTPPGRIPLRILLTNYRYFLAGGSDRYLFSVEDALRRRGHRVVPFSVQCSRNRPAPYDHEFVTPPVHEDAWYFHEHALTPGTAMRLARRAIYDPEVRRRTRDAIRRHRLQLSFVLNYQTKLSPAVVYGARDAGVPVVMRLGDFHLSCAALVHFRAGRSCDDCLGRLPWPAVLHRCVKGSAAASLVRAAAMVVQKWMRMTRSVDAFVVPSSFLLDRLLQSGLERGRLYHIPTFVNPPPPPPPSPGTGNVLYVGRISPEKGVAVLLEAFARIAGGTRRLDVVGPDNDGELERLRRIALQRKIPGVCFHGRLEGEPLAERYRCTDVVVVPSLCYENLPNVVLEAMAWARPVVASHIGSLPEAVTDGVDGILVPPGDPVAMATAIETLIRDRPRGAAAGRSGRKRVLAQHAPELHLSRLEALFARLIEIRR